MRRARLLVPGLALAAALVAATSACQPSINSDPSTWSNHDLAAQLVVAGVDMGNLPAAQRWVRAGLGGIVLGGTAPANLGAQLQAVRSAGAVPPLICSDEEGGQVQRLARLIYPLPSAGRLGRGLNTAQIQWLAADYGRRMKALHVDVDLAPVADLGIPGYYIASLDRAFSADPAAVARDANAWAAGMLSAGVLPVVKHWPGHGQATNSHTGSATTPSLNVLAHRDMIPFAAAFAAGVPAVMVGHLTVPGLTEPGRPATVSPAAYRYLRARAGQTLIMTDSMSMGAVTAALGLSDATAALRALQSGADVVLVNSNDPMSIVGTVQHAIDTGTYPRAAAVVAARHMLAVKRRVNQ
jgi:beta-N-acetylhexosaminidase